MKNKKILKQKNNEYFIDFEIKSYVDVYRQKNILFINNQELIQKSIEKSDKFFIYGFVMSYVINSNDLRIEVYDINNNFILNTQTYLFSNENFKIKTIFNTFKAYYFFDLNNFYYNEVVLKFFRGNTEIHKEKIKLKPFDEIIEEHDNFFSNSSFYFNENFELEQYSEKYYFFGDTLYVNKNIFINSFEKIWIGNEKEYIKTDKITVKERLYERTAIGSFYTGMSRFINLKEVYKYSLYPTGKIKENTPNDPDYIPDFYDASSPKNKFYKFSFDIIYKPYKENLIYNSLELNNMSFNEIIISNLSGNCNIVENELLFFDLNNNINYIQDWIFKEININDNKVDLPQNLEVFSDINLKIIFEENSNLKFKVQSNYPDVITTFFHLSPPRINTFKEKGKKTLKKNEIFIVSIKPDLLNLFDIINFNLLNLELISKENININENLIIPHPIYQNNLNLQNIALTNQFNNKRLVLKILNNNAILSINLKML